LRDPHTNLRSAKNNRDFWTSLPEALHQITIVMSDRGILASYRTTLAVPQLSPRRSNADRR
jgi:catalase